MTIKKFSNSLNSLINRLEKGDLVEKDILVRNMVSNLEIDARKRVIYRYKSPFNFIFEPEFSAGSSVGEPGGTSADKVSLTARRRLGNKMHSIFVSLGSLLDEPNVASRHIRATQNQKN